MADTDFLKLDWTTARRQKKSGYWYFFAPGHPLASEVYTSGMRHWVRAARHVASQKLGRWLLASELVQYQDGNPDNLASENIFVISRTEFQAIVGNAPNLVPKICPVCQQTFFVSAGHASFRRTCSTECLSKWVRRFEVTREELLQLVWDLPTIAIAENFCVSDKAISKRCVKLSVPKPPRGYWRLIELGTPHDDALKRLKWPAERIQALDRELDQAVGVAE
ncbi:MAG: hypothetical protein WCE68_08315 [Anaerolineales bacterium]